MGPARFLQGSGNVVCQRLGWLPSFLGGNDERADGIMNPIKNGVRMVRASREALAVLSWEGASGHRSPFGRTDSGGSGLAADADHGSPWAGIG